MGNFTRFPKIGAGRKRHLDSWKPKTNMAGSRLAQKMESSWFVGLLGRGP